MSGFYPRAEGTARQVNIGRDNYGTIIFSASSDSARSLYQLPPDIGDFTGRGADIEMIMAKVRTAVGTPAIINMYGPPGVGKSALALHIAHHLASHFSDAQLYVDAGAAISRLDERDMLTAFVNALAPASGLVYTPLQELRARYLSALSALRCLVLIDNAQDEQQVRALIPSSAQSVVLITSRTPLAALDGVYLHRVHVLDGQEAADLLSTVIARPVAESADALRSIATACGGLPLALRIAGAIAKKRPYLPLQHLAGQLAEERHRLRILKQGDLDIRGSFALSYQALSPPGRTAFRMSSLTPTADFLAEDIARLLNQSVDIANENLQELVDAQLVETTDGVTFRDHDLLALFAAELGDDEDGVELRAAARQRLLQALADDFSRAYCEAWQHKRWRLAEWLEDWAYSPMSAGAEKLYVRQRLRPGDKPTHSMNWAQAIARTPRMLIFGGPGSGKTTLAERVCFETSGKRSRSYDLGFSVPLRQYGGEPSLEPLITTWVKYDSGLRFSVPVLRVVLAQRKTLVTFDSIDELPQETRGQCVAAISSFCVEHPEVAVIVTSRGDRQLQASGIPGFAQYSLCDFSDAEAEGYMNTCMRLRSSDYPAIGAEPGKTLHLSAMPWTHNPLLLTWIVTMYLRDGYMPREEDDLHEAIFNMTLGSRDIYRGIVRTSNIGPVEIRDSACFLAYWMKSSTERVTGVTEDQIIAALAVAFSYGSDAAREVVTFLSNQLSLVYQSGIGSDGTPLFSIVQDLFGEYLAARWIARRSNSIEEFARTLILLVSIGRFDRGWRYAIKLRTQQDGTAEKAQLISALHAAAAAYVGLARDSVADMLLSYVSE